MYKSEMMRLSTEVVPRDGLATPMLKGAETVKNAMGARRMTLEMPTI